MQSGRLNCSMLPMHWEVVFHSSQQAIREGSLWDAAQALGQGLLQEAAYYLEDQHCCRFVAQALNVPTDRGGDYGHGNG